MLLYIIIREEHTHLWWSCVFGWVSGIFNLLPPFSIFSFPFSIDLPLQPRLQKSLVLPKFEQQGLAGQGDECCVFKVNRSWFLRVHASVTPCDELLHVLKLDLTPCLL